MKMKVKGLRRVCTNQLSNAFSEGESITIKL